VGGGAADHMVTWNAGLDTDSRANTAVLYVIAFERANVDDDFQDAVYEVRIPVGAAVPEPATVSMLAAGLCLLGWSARRRRNQD
jgi:PEP-CTERM motif